MPDIKTKAQARIGDESYTGVVTSAVLSALHGLFIGRNAQALKPTHIAVGTGAPSWSRKPTGGRLRSSPSRVQP